MPISAPKRLLDAMLRQGVEASAAERRIQAEVAKQLDRLRKDLIYELGDSRIDESPRRTDWQRARMKAYLGRAGDKIEEAYQSISDSAEQGFKGIIEVSARELAFRINQALGADLLQPLNWTQEALARIASETLIQGAASSEWWSRQAAGLTNAFKDSMRAGMMRGEALSQLRSRIEPDIRDIANQALAPRDLFRTARRNAEALVRTSALTVMREANLDVFEANLDVLKGVQWCATLDNRTSALCRGLDGLAWSLPGYEPTGHSHEFPGPSPHWNCRSVVVPVTKTWEELIKDAGGDADLAKKLDAASLSDAERASIGGPVPNMTYEEWQKTQFQVDREEFEMWFSNPKGDFAINNLPQHIKGLLKTESDALVFSRETLAKQKSRHPEIKAAEYVRVINKIGYIEEIYNDGPFHARLLTVDRGKSYRIVIKATQDRQEAYLSSLYRQREKDVARVRKTKKATH